MAAVVSAQGDRCPLCARCRLGRRGRVDFGTLENTKEECRDARRIAWLSYIAQDPAIRNSHVPARAWIYRNFDRFLAGMRIEGAPAGGGVSYLRSQYRQPLRIMM